MKKFFLFLLPLFFLLAFSTKVNALDLTSQESIEYFGDGSYVITTINDNLPSPSSSLFSLSTTTTKSKTARYYNASNEIMWYVKVTGTFIYGNGSSKCITASITANTSNKAWKISNKSAGKSGATATATATAKQYFSGTVVNTIKKTVKLTCSPTGVFS